jgi:RimJ/RimL family protein N-acetyltransferase
VSDFPFTAPGFDVALRPIRVEDVDAIMTWINDPEVTRNFAGMSRHITRDQELAFLRGVLSSDTDRLYAIEDSATGRYLGNAGLHKIYWPARNGRVGLVIGAKNARGAGLGQQALRLLLGVGFEVLGLHKVWLVHFATNERMAHIAGKLGFREEGRLRDEYFHDGSFHDMVRRCVLEGEVSPLR